MDNIIKEFKELAGDYVAWSFIFAACIRYESILEIVN